MSFSYGVSLYSYTGDMHTVLTLDDAMAEIADLGATGIEILGEGNIPGYPEPSAEWIDAWHARCAHHGLTPTNYGSWIDTSLWHDRDLTADEGAAMLARDLGLAATLGFTFLRPKVGVVSHDLKPHPVWEGVVERNLDRAAELGIVICPEIHAPTPIRHEVVDGYLAFLERTGTKNFGLLIDTGIFQRAPVTAKHEVLPHVVFIQAKFFDIDADLTDATIPWREILTTLDEHGWSGWLSSEYEGDRAPYRSLEQVRRQHALLRSIEAELRA
ncbi:sugar phosphate isomerase/epimerase family protein [Amycolatopsis sp. NPDC006131]|uniref:sugar phosphate isomerase/epimerase family protein n=1 Tax=Amycolatopsis sp. NPDC006131 TaxID=3156731 RepID=UPI0033AAD86C